MNKRLINAVIRQLGGRESLQDVYNHGADGGFHGFIYHKDTVRFFRNNKKEIIELAQELADDLGESVLNMIQGFRCIGSDYSIDEIGKTLWGKWQDDDAHTVIANGLAWFALEEVARYVIDGYDQE